MTAPQTTRRAGTTEILPGVFLTRAQRAYARLLLAEIPDREIATRLKITVDTARVHRKSVYRRLGVNSIDGAMARLRVANLTEPRKPRKVAKAK